MRLLVDAMPASYGGIAVWTENLLAAWCREFPEDEVHVVLPAGFDAWPVPTGVHRHEIRFPRWAWIVRPFVVSATLPRLAGELGCEALLAVNPATVLRSPAVPLAVVVHDLRHELRPEQFPLHRRVMRVLSHRHGIGLASVVVAVSERTADDLRATMPGRLTAPPVVVAEGADHVDAWARGPAHGRALAFAHHSNKNLELVLDAWAGDPGLPDLLVVGLGRVAGREEVAARVAAAGLDGRVELAPFLPAEEFERTMTGARVVVFPSDFEGFGLPVVEAMRLRIPVVIGPEPACLEVAGGHAHVMASWTPAALGAAVRSAVAATAADVDAAGDRADRFTWGAAAAGVRSALAGVAGRS